MESDTLPIGSTMTTTMDVSETSSEFYSTRSPPWHLSGFPFLVSCLSLCALLDSRDGTVTTVKRLSHHVESTILVLSLILVSAITNLPPLRSKSHSFHISLLERSTLSHRHLHLLWPDQVLFPPNKYHEPQRISPTTIGRCHSTRMYVVRVVSKPLP